MDNASKALIMAGAILIAVMLVSLGVMLFSRAQDVAEDSVGTIDALGVDAYNNQFLQYVGSDIRGTSILQLCSKIEANNAVSTINTITISGIGTSAQLATNAVVRSHYYTVTVTGYDTTTGAISGIQILHQVQGKKGAATEGAGGAS